MCEKVCFCFWLSLIVACWTANECPSDEIPVELPEGFAIRKLAGDELVPDACCLALDPIGNPVVSGPGYLKRLRATDGEDVLSGEELAKLQGVAQGVCVDDGLLWLTANGAILRSKPREDATQSDAVPMAGCMCCVATTPKFAKSTTV